MNLRVFPLELSGVARVERPCDAPDDFAGTRKFRQRLRLFARLREFERQRVVASSINVTPARDPSAALPTIRSRRR